MSYTELHSRSAFSFHRGATQAETLVHRAAELAYPAIAITDRDGVYGSARAHAASKVQLANHPQSIRAITGAEITLEDNTALPLLIATRSGYQNLCRMLTRAKLRAPKNASKVTYAELEEFVTEAGQGSLIALTGDEEGPLRTHLQNGDLEQAHQTLTRLKNILGAKNLYVELQRHYARDEGWTNHRLQELAQTENLPIIATNGATFAFQNERPLYDAFTCLRHHTLLDTAGALLSRNTQRFLKSPRQMAALFADLPEAIDNTQRLADRLEFNLQDLGYQFPKFPVPSEPQHLREKTYAGARERYGQKLSKKVRDQLDHELRIITKLGFCGYFLIVWDIVNFAREQGILVQGRGSAANSAVCYSLGITACDPIGYELLFERFLSEGRESWPDIDLDLPSGDRRESVIQEVYRRFAPRGAAMTANVITYRGKSAIREMGKVLGFPETVLGRFSDLYGGHGGGDSKEELTERLKKSGLAQDHPRLPALLHLYNAVRGLPRHLGQHSGGMIISDRGLDSVVPLENASMPGRRVVQWDKDDCEDLGIIKVDLLGLGMMAAIQDTLTLCNSRPNRAVDIAQLPKDDPKTYQMIQRADTIGVFQIESRAQMATLPRLKPRNFYDICVEVAIIRPGPIVGGLVHPYINRRNGREPITYIHEAFRPILRRTLGIPLFQEQVLQMAMVIADFTGSEAEELRRAISFKRSDERMQRVMQKLRAGMDKMNIPTNTQEEVVKAISSFALYGFPESHAISFALLAYASSWLKAHRAAEFYTALLNNQPMGFYSPATLLMDAKNHGIKIRPVCVRESDYNTTVEADHILRLGLRQVKHLSTKSALRIHEEKQNRPWQNLDDFLHRTQIDKTERRTLAKIGALNSLAAHRRDALWNIEQTLPENDLFSPTQKVAEQESAYKTSPLAQMQPIERLAADYEGLDLSTGPHPMAYIRKTLPNVWRAIDLEQARNGQVVLIAGLVICRQRPSTAAGHMFISLEDETGIANAFVPSKTFERLRLIISQERFLQIKGRVQIADNVTSIYTQEVESISYQATISSTSHDFH